tara:strand:- start:61268 stop:61378 length:111 start_codon:yes stop_codon:yes gene_type:complete
MSAIVGIFIALKYFSILEHFLSSFNTQGKLNSHVQI